MITKHNIEEYFADYLDGGLDAQKSKELAEFLEQNPDFEQEFEDLKSLYRDLPPAQNAEPNEFLDLDFYTMIEKEKAKKPAGRQIAFVPNWQSVMKYAAMILAIAGAYFIGFKTKNEQIVIREKPIYITKEIEKPVDRIVEVEKIKTVQVSSNLIPKDTKSTDNQDVTKQINEIKNQIGGIQEVQKRMILAMLKQESASERLQAVNFSYDMRMADDTILNALIRTLDYDPNINVRMAAVEAVGRFGKVASVRTSLVNSLMKQNDPAMQIAVIDLLIDLREKRALPIFASLAESSQSDNFVKEKAENGIKLLNL
jgi:hypothetical protein